ncbi:hypothetical protein I317_00795 [Kwoniella heveanensis CBS 569]|nr:hypothetical protein I317_00795 [Kwoniella heveanensis CBS 569]
MNHGLPARPNFSAAETSSQPQAPKRQRPQDQQTRNPTRGAHVPQQQQHASTSFIQSQAPINITGGYNPFPIAHAQAGAAYNNPYSSIASTTSTGTGGYDPTTTNYYQPANLTGGYPTFPLGVQGYPAQTFGQSLFEPQLQPGLVNPSGYAYSSTYVNPLTLASSSSSVPVQPNAKRQRPNPNPGPDPGPGPGSSFNPMGTVGSSMRMGTITSASTGPTASSSAFGTPFVDGTGQSQTPTHMWRNCSHPGCKFVGPGNEVEIHEGDRHLIFPNGKPMERSEEEERYARRKGPPPPIQGTSITLNTPEDIEKWIAERKAKWPSAKRVQEKEEERKAAIARGDIPARGRGGKRGRGGRMVNDAAYLAEEWGRAPPPNVPVIVTSSRGRGRGRGRGAERGRGRGRGGHGHGYGTATTKVAGTAANLPTITPTPAQKTGLAALEGYDTPNDSGSSSSSSSGSSSDSSDSDSDSSTDAETDTEHADSKSKNPIPGDHPKDTAQTGFTTAAAQTKPVCKFFAKNGRCKNGDKCRFAHTEGDTAAPASAVPGTGPQFNSIDGGIRQKANLPRQPPPKRANPFERPSMLGSTIRFLVANDFLRGVELKVGDAEDQARERNKVVEQPQADNLEVGLKEEKGSGGF